MKKVLVSRITDLVLEGYSLSEAISIFEARIDANNITEYTNSPAYKNLETNCWKMLKKVEDAIGYKRSKFDKDPRQTITDELEELEYIANVIQSFALFNYSSDIKTALTKLVRSAFRGVSEGYKKLERNTDEELLAAFTPLEYTKRALENIADAFKLLDVPWTLDYRWENYLNDTDRKKGPQAKKDADGKRIIDYAVPEGKERD